MKHIHLRICSRTTVVSLIYGGSEYTLQQRIALGTKDVDYISRWRWWRPKIVGRKTYFYHGQDSQRTYNVTLRRVRATTVAVEKSISITCSECVFVSSIQRACATLSSVVCWALQHFFYLISRFSNKKVTEHKMSVLTSSTTFIWIISHSKTNWMRYDHEYNLVFM